MGKHKRSWESHQRILIFHQARNADGKQAATLVALGASRRTSPTQISRSVHDGGGALEAWRHIKAGADRRKYDRRATRTAIPGLRWALGRQCSAVAPADFRRT